MKVLFPVSYWPLILRYSQERQLDPYLVAALIAQESTFMADVRSAANAYGLMQLLPSTGRQYARALRLPKRSKRDIEMLLPRISRMTLSGAVRRSRPSKKISPVGCEAPG